MGRKKYRATFAVYNVAERMEENGVDIHRDDPSWFEYEVDLLCGHCGEHVSSFDSLHETYNGVQRLSKAEAERAARELVGEVEGGDVSAFTILGHKCRKGRAA